MTKSSTDEAAAFWESREQVERFAARKPDHRLVRLAKQYPDPARVRVLDLGCAGGRNTVFLAERGFDVLALDSSGAMVAETRKRLAAVVGDSEARRRVRWARMERLEWADRSFGLVVALGIYQCAQSRAEWDRALSESARVLRRGGRLLVANFTPQTDLTGRGVTKVPGERHLYEGLPGGRACLLDALDLDREMARWGLAPLVPTETVVREAAPGRRATANALYVKR